MLRLTQVNVEDAGRYTCVVTNIAGEKRKNFDLFVLGTCTRIIRSAKKIGFSVPTDPNYSSF